MLGQVVGAMLAHSWFKNHEPTAKAAAGSLLVLPLLAHILESKAFQPGVSFPNIFFATRSSIFLEYIVFHCALVTSIVIYRLSPWHPLAKYPGPLLPRVTKLWIAWVATQGGCHQYAYEQHKRYGPVVRMGPNELSIIEKDAIPHILGSQGMPKGPMWDGRRYRHAGYKNPYDTLLDSRDAKTHSQLRKPWNAAFSAGPVKDYCDILEIRGKQLRDHLQAVVESETKGMDVDLSKWLSLFSFDFMGDLAFGGYFELMRLGDVDRIWKFMEEAEVVPAITQHIPWITPLILVAPIVGAMAQAFGKFGVELAEKRLAMQTTYKDLFHHLYEVPAEQSGQSIKDQMHLIVSNSILTIVAGSDTVASTLSAVVCHLMSHRKALNTLRTELDEAFPVTNELDGWPEIEIDELTKLPYLNAVINEGLRLVPPVPTHLQRAPEPGSGGKMLGHTQIFVPEGVAVNVPPFALHRDPRYFSPSPDVFVPERWLGSSEGEYHTARDAFIPFSYGPANCPGKPLALIELRYLIAILVRCFDIHHASCRDASPKVLEARTKAWVGNLKDHFVFGKSELPVDLVSRKQLIYWGLYDKIEWKKFFGIFSQSHPG